MAAVAAAQKNREMFAIKKSYSIEVCNQFSAPKIFKVENKNIEKSQCCKGVSDE